MSLMPVPALALDSGVYTGTVTTSYYNPDTGNIDDGGTANAALGEGMCRSATAETGLVEVDKDGSIWLTIRLLLQSNCKNVTFYTRTDYDSYSQASYSVTSEDSANDSIDYRFKVSDAGVKLKCTMYVTPMGRDVLWYLYVETNTLTAGSGDFVVSIDTSTPEEPAAPPAATVPPADTASPAAAQPAGPTPEATEKSAETPTSAEPADTPTPEKTGTAGGADQAAPDVERDAAPAVNVSKDTPGSSAPADGESALESEAPGGGKSGGLGGAIAGIAAAVIVVAGGSIIHIRRRKK